VGISSQDSDCVEEPVSPENSSEITLGSTRFMATYSNRVLTLSSVALRPTDGYLDRFRILPQFVSPPMVHFESQPAIQPSPISPTITTAKISMRYGRMPKTVTVRHGGAEIVVGVVRGK
jgi:hypothetical protein